VLATFGLPHFWIAERWPEDAATLGVLVLGILLALARWRGWRVATWIAWLVCGAGLAALMTGRAIGAAGIGTPMVLALVHAGLRSERPSMTRSAAAAGASPWMIFRELLLPAMAPGIAAAAVLVQLTELVASK